MNVARETLDADHAGLEEVKDRILEYLAVHKFRRERDISDERSGAILALVGPPGVGKTSRGELQSHTKQRSSMRPDARSILMDAHGPRLPRPLGRMTSTGFVRIPSISTSSPNLGADAISGARFSTARPTRTAPTIHA